MYDFRFVKVNISNQQLNILLDVSPLKVISKILYFWEMGSWTDVQSEKLKQAGDWVHPNLIETSSRLNWIPGYI